MAGVGVRIASFPSCGCPSRPRMTVVPFGRFFGGRPPGQTGSSGGAVAGRADLEQATIRIAIARHWATTRGSIWRNRQRGDSPLTQSGAAIAVEILRESVDVLLRGRKRHSGPERPDGVAEGLRERDLPLASSSQTSLGMRAPAPWNRSISTPPIRASVGGHERQGWSPNDLARRAGPPPGSWRRGSAGPAGAGPSTIRPSTRDS